MAAAQLGVRARGAQVGALWREHLKLTHDELNMTMFRARLEGFVATAAFARVPVALERPQSCNTGHV